MSETRQDNLLALAYAIVVGGKKISNPWHERKAALLQMRAAVDRALDELEREAGHTRSADAACQQSPAPSRLNSEGGASRSSPMAVISTPLPSFPHDDGEGHKLNANNARGSTPSPSSPNRSAAGQSGGANKANTPMLTPAVVHKPPSLPVRTERVHYGQKNESEADIAAKLRLTRERGELLAQTFSVYGERGERDMAEVDSADVPDLDRRYVAALGRKAEDFRQHVVKTMAVRAIKVRLGDRMRYGKSVEDLMPRHEIRAIRNECELRVASMTEVMVDAAARELKAEKKADPSTVQASAMFGDAIKLIGGAHA